MSKRVSAWVSVYLYYNPPYERFLSDALYPFVQNILRKKLADGFFFVRYFDHGPHIRLRLSGTGIMLKSSIEFFFLDYFKRYPSKRNISQKIISQKENWYSNNSLRFSTYQPEISRYGGPIGIEIAETYHKVSSETILSILNENKNWSYELALGIAVKLHLTMVCAFGVSKSYSIDFFKHLSWHYHSNNEKKILEFEKNFKRQKRALSTHLKLIWTSIENESFSSEVWLSIWFKNMKKLGEKLYTAQKNNKLKFATNRGYNTKQIWSIYESYIHMTNNRLGISGIDEMFLAYILQRVLEEM